MNISVVGLGYIGLPLSQCFCDKGFNVFGVDVNENLVGDLKRAQTNVHEMNGEETLQQVLRRNLDSGRFFPTTNIASIASYVDTYVITVGMPVSRDGSLHYDMFLQAVEQLGAVLKRGDLVLFRSTVVPGILEDRVLPILEEYSGLEPGVDFNFAYAAERVAEGRAMLEFQTLDIVAAGLTPDCERRARELLSQLTNGTIHCTNLRIAQAVKVIENVQRDVNIALAQEIALYADYHDVDVNELIEMANTHPRVKLLKPGIGVGGFCIPNAYHYLAGSLEDGQSLPLFGLARAENTQVPHRIVLKLSSLLRNKGKSLSDSVIAVLGLGMKDNSNDIRLSPSIDLIDILQSRGARVRAFDSTVQAQLPYLVGDLSSCVNGADALIVATWQREFEELDLIETLEAAGIGDAVIDVRNHLRNLKDRVFQIVVREGAPVQ